MQIKLINLLNELEINRPIQTWDVRRDNWPNLSSKTFDKIKVGDKIIDPEFIEYVYEIDYDQLLNDKCVNYSDEENGRYDKFLTRSWFDIVSQED